MASTPCGALDTWPLTGTVTVPADASVVPLWPVSTTLLPLYDDSTQTVFPMTTGRFGKPGIGEVYGASVMTFPVTGLIRSRKPWEMA